jgi:hypothetical protein
MFQDLNGFFSRCQTEGWHLWYAFYFLGIYCIEGVELIIKLRLIQGMHGLWREDKIIIMDTLACKFINFQVNYSPLLL